MKYYDPVVEKNKVAMTSLKVIFFILLVLYFTSCANILTELGNKTREAAAIKAIEIELDTDPAAALVLFNALDASIQAKRDNQVLLATIHAGICGQNFFDITEGLAEVGDMMFKLMGVFSSATSAQVDSCLSARDVITGIESDPANRTANENILMTYISWSTMGAIMSLYADTDDDDAIDGGFDACADISDARAASVAVAFNMMIESLSNAGGSGAGAAELALLDALCTGGAPYNDFCGITDQAVMETKTAAGDGLDDIKTVIKQGGGIGLGVGGVCP